MNVNAIYNSITFDSTGETAAKSVEEQWKNLPLFKRRSSEASAMHLQVYKNTVDLPEVHDALQRLQPIIDAGCSESELASAILDDKYLFELVKMEHRRWCYFMICEGWTYSEEKQPDYKRHDCLCNMDTLIAKRPETIKYDLIPFIVLLKQGGSDDIRKS